MELFVESDDKTPLSIGGKTPCTAQVIVDDEGVKCLPDALERILPLGHVALCFDDSVKDIGEVAADVVRRAGYSTECAALDKLAKLREDARLLISIGGGGAANAVKLEASKRGVEWVHLMTCASTDSALYPYAELFADGRRKVVPCTPPSAVVIDEGALKTSPKRCTAAGYGTLFSKLMTLFSLRANAMSEGMHHPAEEALAECLNSYFSESSAEHPAVRTARTLVKTGLIAECVPVDFLQREEYHAALALSAYRRRERLIGEDAMLATIAIASIYGAYFAHAPSDLFVPCGYCEDLRMLDKLCGLDMLTSILDFKRGDKCARKLFVAREYRNEWAALLSDTFGPLAARARAFRRLYGDAGFWLGGYVSPDALIGLTALSAATLEDDSLLRALKQSGLLDAAKLKAPLERLHLETA